MSSMGEGGIWVLVAVIVFVIIVIVIMINNRKSEAKFGGGHGGGSYGHGGWHGRPGHHRGWGGWAPGRGRLNWNYWAYPYNIVNVELPEGREKIKVGYALSDTKLTGGRNTLDIYSTGVDSDGILDYLFVDGSKVIYSHRTLSPIADGDKFIIDIDGKQVNYTAHMD